MIPHGGGTAGVRLPSRSREHQGANLHGEPAGILPGRAPLLRCGPAAPRAPSRLRDPRSLGSDRSEPAPPGPAEPPRAVPARGAGHTINREIGANNRAAIDRADGVVAVLDGVDVDSGTAAEIGYAFARGKR